MEECQRSVLLQRIASLLTDIKPKCVDTTMHDVNVDEMIKAELSILALLLSSSTDIESNESRDIMMHDINIEEMIKQNYRF